MALELLKAPSGQSDAGVFNLPADFDTSRYAAEWVLESQVASKRQRQNLVGTGYTADGWEVWRTENNSEPTVVTTAGNKRFVLMCRPQEIQKQVNALFGNLSKTYVNNEIRGASIAGAAPQDAGILTSDRLKHATGEGSHTDEESTHQMNQVFDRVPAAQIET